MELGKHATCYSFCLERGGKLPCDEIEREKRSAWGVILGLGWGPERHSRPKKAGRQSKRNSSLPRFTLSITNCLRDWKQLYSSTWMMHLSSALSKTATGLNQGPSVCVFSGGSCSHRWLYLRHSILPYVPRAFAKILWCIVWWNEFRSRI